MVPRIITFLYFVSVLLRIPCRLACHRRLPFCARFFSCMYRFDSGVFYLCFRCSRCWRWWCFFSAAEKDGYFIVGVTVDGGDVAVVVGGGGGGGGCWW